MPESPADGPPLVDASWLETVRERIEAADGLLLCLDFDGTLAPIVDDPTAATMAPGNRAVLERLSRTPDVRVALVSGRELADLRRRIDLDGVCYAGNHGLELDDGSGRTVVDGATGARPTLERTLEHLRAALTGVPGCRIEDKDFSITVHYRETPPDRVPFVLETVEDVLDSSPTLRASTGKQIREIRPDVPGGKGRALERFRAPHREDLPVFIGDDVTDEDGFRAVGDDGFGVLVGGRSDSAADVRVPNTGCVTMLLTWFAQACGDLAGEPAGERSPRVE